MSVGTTSFTNSGTILGGTSTTGGAGTGAQVRQNTTLINNGTVQGGDSAGGTAGIGVDLGSAAGTTATLVNRGTIRGGSNLADTVPVGTGSVGVFMRAGAGTVTNTGTIEGGKLGVAITGNAVSTMNIINSGTIKAGAGQDNAIVVGQPTAVIVLELQQGSTIIGNVVAGTTANDTLRLGGSADGVFDISSVGASAQYRNFDIFQKTGTGTWALIGTGTSTTPWTVNQGTLQIGNGGASGSLASDVTVNAGATLAFNRSDTYSYGGLISGAGGVTQAGSGTTVLTAANTYTGPTTINLGTLAIDGSITSAVTVNAAGTLAGRGTVNGDVTNSGAVMPGSAPGALTIAGNYIGNGGAVRISGQFGGDNSTVGRLVVTGNTSGSGKVQIVNLGGLGARTAEGIKIIDVQGASNADFTLAGDYTLAGKPAVVAGAYTYQLFKNGISTPADGDWYLRSASIAPTVPVYQAYAGVMRHVNELDSFRQRVGNRSWSSPAAASGETGKIAAGQGPWARVDGSNTHIDPSSGTLDSNYNVRTWKFEAGLDMPVYENNDGTLVASPSVHYGTASASVSSSMGSGSIDVSGYGIGGALTWYGNNGSYVDAQATVNWYDTDLLSGTTGAKVATGNGSTGFAAGVEAGHKLPIGGNWSVTPQVQLAWSQVRFHSFTDKYGAAVSPDSGNSLVTRLGVSLDHETKGLASNGKVRRAHAYGVANLYYDFMNGTSSHVSDISVTSKEPALWGGIGVGGSLNWDDERYTLYGEALVRTSLQGFGDSYSIGARIGARMKW